MEIKFKKKVNVFKSSCWHFLRIPEDGSFEGERIMSSLKQGRSIVSSKRDSLISTKGAFMVCAK